MRLIKPPTCSVDMIELDPRGLQFYGPDDKPIPSSGEIVRIAGKRRFSNCIIKCEAGESLELGKKLDYPLLFHWGTTIFVLYGIFPVLYDNARGEIECCIDYFELE